MSPKLINPSVSGVRMQSNNKFSHISDELGNKLVKHVLWGIALIGLAAFLCSMSGLLETILIIEIATTISALLVSGICLLHLYREHRAYHDQEQQLIQSLLKEIQKNFKHLPPKAELEETLLAALKTNEAKEQRVQILLQYRQQPAALSAFVNYCRQRYADHAVLADLGLCWD
jgi:hypothetical protein